jgi:transcription elongation factor SPT6
MEELHDVYEHFLLYYGPDMTRMKKWLKEKRRKQREADAANGEDVGPEPAEPEVFKYANRRSGYTMCVSAGLGDLARRFGLTAEQFAENLRDNYSKHDVEQDPLAPAELAKDFIGRFVMTWTKTVCLSLTCAFLSCV